MPPNAALALEDVADNLISCWTSRYGELEGWPFPTDDEDVALFASS